MNRSETIASYFMRIAELRDQLGDIGEMVPDRELSTYVLRGLLESWKSFVQSVSGHSKMLKYDRLWVDCSEEGARLATKHGNAYDENWALAARSSDWKGKKKSDRKDFHRRDRRDRRDDRLSSSRSRDKRDYSKVQCFGCKELGNIRRDCPKKRVSKKLLEQRLMMSSP